MPAPMLRASSGSPIFRPPRSERSSARSRALQFVGLAVVHAGQRANLLGMVRWLDRWSFGAGLLLSVGQIAMFAALLYEDVSVIVMIASLDVFLASFLAVVIFRTERRPDRATYLAAALATGGVVLVAIG